MPLSANSHSSGRANGLRRLVRYSYSIAGVTYETAQDVTGIVYIALLVALVAFMVGSLRARYGRRGRRPGGPRR